jgi:hypothetical protein
VEEFLVDLDLWSLKLVDLKFAVGWLAFVPAECLSGVEFDLALSLAVPTIPSHRLALLVLQVLKWSVLDFRVSL